MSERERDRETERERERERERETRERDWNLSKLYGAFTRIYTTHSIIYFKLIIVPSTQ